VLVFKFFAIFSLFEYALKSAGYRNENGDATPDWERFARAIEKDFNPESSEELLEAVKYLYEKPPMRQIVENGTIRWMKRVRPPGKSDLEWLSLIIRAVRNNLFHGGKFVYERPRDTLLVQYSSTVLEAWAECSDKIQHALERIQP
jgi:hypothetical protein